MATIGKQEVALACVPGAIPPAERAAHFQLLEKLFARKVPTEIRDGYAYDFVSADFAELARFIENERMCCPFLRFVLEVNSDDAGVRLELTGPEHTREFLDARVWGMSMDQLAVQLSDANFASAINESKVIALDFWTDWCAPCRIGTRMLSEKSAEVRESH